MRAVMFCFLILSAILFLDGCADEPGSNPTDSPSARAVAGPFTRSEFFRYDMVQRASDSYRLPYANDIVFHLVKELFLDNAFLYLPRLIVWGASPLTVTVDETIRHEFLLSGVAVQVTAPERCGMEEKKECWTLSGAEVIFQTSAGADAFNAALLAVRTTTP